MMDVIIIDNYDSFTYNLYHYLQPMVGRLEVVRNDKVELNKLDEFDGIVYSPGPGIPEEAGIMFDILHKYEKSKSILGICLGHQAIIEFYGGKLTNLEMPLHGLTIQVRQTLDYDKLFHSLPETFDTGRYHSWACRLDNLPEVLQSTAIDADNMVMGLRHQEYNIRGVQYHPESVMTPHGKTILRNWITKC